MQARGKPQLPPNWTLWRAAPYRIYSQFVQNDVVCYRVLQRHKLMSTLSWLTTARERNRGNKRLSRNHIRTATSHNEGITQFDSYFIIGLLDELVMQSKLHSLLVTTMAQTKHNTSRILQWRPLVSFRIWPIPWTTSYHCATTHLVLWIKTSFFYTRLQCASSICFLTSFSQRRRIIRW